MLKPEKRNVAGILLSPVTYESTIDFIVSSAREKRSATVSALAVHGVMTGVLDREHRYRLNHFDLLVPDGQPVRWVLNLLHGAQLSDRVYGPELTKRLCARAADESLPIFLYGSTEPILQDFQNMLRRDYPNIRIAGAEPSRFRRLDKPEKYALIERIKDSGAALLFVGLGCPRQEVFAFEMGSSLPMPVIAVGAAFPFLAGHIPQAPGWMQKRGLEWLYRLSTEPRRLWRRYLYLNPAYVVLVALQAIGVTRSPLNTKRPITEELYG
jgi:N-acetylglucosaminyldiphosphoundecaprenol N-acetyl-beta-D-mannosaminyltransferase